MASPICRAELDEKRNLPWICRCPECNRIRNDWKKADGREAPPDRTGQADQSVNEEE